VQICKYNFLMNYVIIVSDVFKPLPLIFYKLRTVASAIKIPKCFCTANNLLQGRIKEQWILLNSAARLRKNKAPKVKKAIWTIVVKKSNIPVFNATKPVVLSPKLRVEINGVYSNAEFTMPLSTLSFLNIR
jgi:hypothetical protein